MADKEILPNLPNLPGVYLMRDSSAAIVYIGKAKNLRKRVSCYFLESRMLDAKTQALMMVVRHVDYVGTASEREALLLEQRLINQFKPTFNVMWKDDKSYPYVALTVQEDYPRIFLTRTKRRDGTLYFGPYPSVQRVRNLLHWTWRKRLFPMRLCDLDIKEGQPYPYEKVKSCLYLHTQQCAAPCLAKISKRDYSPIVQKARWFFEGREDKMVLKWKKEMARFAKKQMYEQAAEVRDRLDTLQHMHEQVTFREMSEQMLESRVLGSRGVQDLMKQLDMKKPPESIECFDISHIQGVEKVASMVRFDRGRANKSEYRKYIIRTVEGIDDFKAMGEVVGRRYRRLKKEGRSFPDLILIDGGKGQLSAALEALKRENVEKISVAALAKREEEIYLPDRNEPLRLSADSPALLLLRQIRDEAHRFAITFHRSRRDKRMMGQFN